MDCPVSQRRWTSRSHWSLASTNDFHRYSGTSRSQADPRPLGGAAKRSAAISKLQGELADAAHDLFTLSPGLGLHAGNVFAHTTPHPLPASSIARSLGVPLDVAVNALIRLSAVGIVRHSSAGWSRPDIDGRALIARQLEVEGRLRARALRYESERELWAWCRRNKPGCRPRVGPMHGAVHGRPAEPRTRHRDQRLRRPPSTRRRKGRFQASSCDPRKRRRHRRPTIQTPNHSSPVLEGAWPENAQD